MFEVSEKGTGHVLRGGRSRFIGRNELDTFFESEARISSPLSDQQLAIPFNVTAASETVTP